MYKYMYQLPAPMSHVSACFNHMTGLTKDCTSFSTSFFACFGFSSRVVDTDPCDALNVFNAEFSSGGGGSVELGLARVRGCVEDELILTMQCKVLFF